MARTSWTCKENYGISHNATFELQHSNKDRGRNSFSRGNHEQRVYTRQYAACTEPSSAVQQRKRVTASADLVTRVMATRLRGLLGLGSIRREKRWCAVRVLLVLFRCHLFLYTSQGWPWFRSFFHGSETWISTDATARASCWDGQVYLK